MRRILLLFLLFTGLTAYAQVTNVQVEPKGVYQEINISKERRVIQLLADTSDSNPTASLIDSVEKNANQYAPPVLYVLSGVLFNQKRYNEACFWFYVAQLRARYDVNRCTDKTANADEYNEGFGPNIKGYAARHLDTLKTIIKKVVDFVGTNEELYDQRWINLTGMDAMGASLGEKPTNKALSADKSQWPAIKKKTIDTYYSDFKDELGLDNEDPTVDKSHMLGYDYALFKGTPAWELAKAVQNQDTVKIAAIISGSKGLLEYREPKFGQTLLLMAVQTLKFESAKTLIFLGADPNSKDTYDGTTPVIAAAKIILADNYDYGSNPKYLKLLLEHKGNPNTSGKRGNTPLTEACGIGDIEYVKILVNAGANVNSGNNFISPLYNACLAPMTTKEPDLVIYLIQKGADYKKPLYKTIDGENKYITDEMREWRFDIGSEGYKKKMQLAEFLKKNGMDYWRTSIPKEYYKHYPKEYLDKY